jgi:hypothetical protein
LVRYASKWIWNRVYVQKNSKQWAMVHIIIRGPHIVMSRTDAQNGLDFHFKANFPTTCLETWTFSKILVWINFYLPAVLKYWQKCTQTKTTG